MMIIRDATRGNNAKVFHHNAMVREITEPEQNDGDRENDKNFHPRKCTEDRTDHIVQVALTAVDGIGHLLLWLLTGGQSPGHVHHLLQELAVLFGHVVSDGHPRMKHQHTHPCTQQLETHTERQQAQTTRLRHTQRQQG